MSGQFAFRLERVRNLREREEDLAREALAAGLADKHQGERALAAATGTVVAARTHTLRRATSPVGATAQDLIAAQVWLERAERLAREAELELDRKDAEVMARRATLTVAARDREAIERLKRRRLDDWQRDVARRDANALDEMALATHRRAHLVVA